MPGELLELLGGAGEEDGFIYRTLCREAHNATRPEAGHLRQALVDTHSSPVAPRIITRVWQSHNNYQIPFMKLYTIPSSMCGLRDFRSFYPSQTCWTVQPISYNLSVCTYLMLDLSVRS